MEASRPPGPIARCLLRPIGWPMFTTVSAVVVWLLWLGLHPHFYYLINVVLLVLLWLALGVAILCRTAIREMLLAKYRQPDTRRAAYSPRAGILAAIGVLVTVLIATKVPLRLALLTARPGLNRLVAQAKSGSLRLAADQKCGLYTISTQRRRCHVRDRLMFILADDPETGFIYSPNGIAELCYNSGNKGHLLGNWYWMAED